MKKEELIGLTLSEAKHKCISNCLRYRLVKKDGVGFPITSDFIPDRLNFEVENEIIIKITNG